MRWLSWLVLALLLVLAVSTPVSARVATIETTAPLQDHSEQSLKAALTEVVQAIAKGAIAMGLSWVQVTRVLVLEDMLTVQVIASDTGPEGVEEVEPGQDGEPSTGLGQPQRFNL